MKRTVKILVPLTIILALVGPGCYTVISHPAGDEGYRANQTSDCTRCHGDYHEYPYGYYYSPYPDYWWEHPDYGSYYADPWWWSYYDYPYIDGEYDASNYRGTKFDRRDHSGEPTPPPYAFPSDDYVRPPIMIPGSGLGSGTTGDGSSGTSRPQTGTVDDNAGSRSKDQDSGATTTKNTRQDTKSSPSTPAENRPAVRPSPQPPPQPDPPAKTDTPKKDDPPPDKPDDSKKGSGGGR